MKKDQTTQATFNADHIPIGGTLYMALELSASVWKVATSDGRCRKPRMVDVKADDLDSLLAEVVKAKRRFKLPDVCPIVSCYEAGRDAFWLDRFLRENGIENLVVDSSSIEVNRRKRRAKTDRLDARKLLAMLIRHHGGEPKVWSVVRVPGLEDEDARHLHREIEVLKGEIQAHRNRVKALGVTQGLRFELKGTFLDELDAVTLWDGSEVPPFLKARLRREYERLEAAKEQKKALEADRKALLKDPTSERHQKVVNLMDLRGIGVVGAWILVMEVFGWRVFDNRQEVGGSVGLTPTPYDSGGAEREQGISKSGSPLVRWLLVQLAWSWLRYQPKSKLSVWFQEKYGGGTSRQRRCGIVALARRLMVALWRYVEQGVVPEGAILQSA